MEIIELQSAGKQWFTDPTPREPSHGKQQDLGQDLADMRRMGKEQEFRASRKDLAVSSMRSGADELQTTEKFQSRLNQLLLRGNHDGLGFHPNVRQRTVTIPSVALTIRQQCANRD